MTGVVVVITGFDRVSDKLAIEVPLPAWAVSATRAIAGVPVDDPDLVGAYPLTEDQVCEFARNNDPLRGVFRVQSRPP